jgi:cell division protein FtsI/penicillin-binding protein 2
VQRVKTLSSGKSKVIRTTVDRRVQAAAEKAVAGASRNAVVVALKPSTGEVLAVADRLGARGAFLNKYPPGSSFKVVTAAALLGDGMGADAGADCPATVVTAQRTISNHDGESLGRTSLRDAFAQSCNTTFARLAVERLKADKLAAAAREFGFGQPVTPGVSAERGSFPDPGSGAELAEAAIGQGRVEASPLMMAMVAAAVEDGTWRSPRMVDADLIRGTGDPIRPAHDIADAADLRSMMRAVVTRGTAAGAGLPSGTAGKTGTAEFGAGGQAHAWFIGFRDDLAFSVFVEAGGSGPKVAAPLAAAFLRDMR